MMQDRWQYDVTSRPSLSVTTASILVLASVYIVAKLCAPRREQNEPPFVQHPVPFVGHIVGLLRYGIEYFDKLSQRTGHPILTVPILNSKVYVIASPDLVTACMRETKTLSFNPFIVEVFRRLAGLSHDDMAITKSNMDDKATPSYMSDMHRVEYAALAPGPDLDAMNETAASEIAAMLERLSGEPLDLFLTTRRISSIAAIRATFGPENPFDRNETLLEDFWFFEKNLKWVLLNVYTSKTMPNVYAARERLIKAFEDYYARNGHLKASKVVRDRTVVALKHGQSMHTIAAFDVGLAFGVLTNAATTVFWLLAYIYHGPDLLMKIRDETAHLVVSKDSATVQFDLRSDAHIRQNCPVLTSTFHETLRHISSSLSSGRYVLEDTILTSSAPDHTSYLLKKGSTVQIPSQSLHFPTSSSFPSPSSSSSSSTSQVKPPSPFHENIHSFSPHRFQTANLPDPSRSINGSFRAFGGGSSLCPGRKFAFMEIMAFVVMFVQLFDVREVRQGGDEGGCGIERIPAFEVGRVAVAVAKPEGRVTVRVGRRVGMEGRVGIRIGTRGKKE